jgi:hypothetical protein
VTRCPGRAGAMIVAAGRSKPGAAPSTWQRSNPCRCQSDAVQAQRVASRRSSRCLYAALSSGTPLPAVSGSRATGGRVEDRLLRARRRAGSGRRMLSPAPLGTRRCASPSVCACRAAVRRRRRVRSRRSSCTGSTRSRRGRSAAGRRSRASACRPGRACAAQTRTRSHPLEWRTGRIGPVNGARPRGILGGCQGSDDRRPAPGRSE